MMLEFAEDDRIARLQLGTSPALGDEVDRLGRSPRKDDLPRVLDPEQPNDLVPDPFEGLRGALAQGMQAAVDAGRVDRYVVENRLDDLLRLEAGCRRVDVDQRNSRADFLPQSREGSPDFLDVDSAAW